MYVILGDIVSHAYHLLTINSLLVISSDKRLAHRMTGATDTLNLIFVQVSHILQSIVLKDIKIVTETSEKATFHFTHALFSY